jgi:acetylornithine deacetylase/succinyl-diaminopimelate desuccinylase-like protein
MEALLDDLSRDDVQFKADMSVPIQVLPMEVTADLPVVAALRNATRQIIGEDPGFSGWSATCDASILVQDGNTPAVIFGPGSIEHAAHRPDESVNITELENCAEIYVLTIQELLG